MVDTNSYEALVRAFRDARHAGASIEEFLADDVCWHVAGRSLIAGEYLGKAEVLAHFERRQSLADGTFAWEVHEVMVGDQHVVERTSGRAHRKGREFKWDALGLIRIERGQIAECWLVPLDLHAFDEAWS